MLAGLLITPVSPADDIEWELNDTYVGVGTGSPSAKLHVQSNENAYTLPLLVENTTSINFSGFRLKVAADSWIDFNNAAGKFRINVDQQPGSEFEVRPNGDAILAGVLTQNSDVNAKQDIQAVYNEEVLTKIMSLSITEWSYKDSPDVRHIGPMAQDFYRLFELGYTDRGITSIDTSGVALAAIQGLHAQLEDRAVQLEQLKSKNAALQVRLLKHEDRMAQLEKALAELTREQSAQGPLAVTDS